MLDILFEPPFTPAVMSPSQAGLTDKLATFYTAMANYNTSMAAYYIAATCPHKSNTPPWSQPASKALFTFMQIRKVLPCTTPSPPS